MNNRLGKMINKFDEMTDCDWPTLGLKCNLAIAAQNHICYMYGPGAKFDIAHAFCHGVCDHECPPCPRWSALKNIHTQEIILK